MRLEQIRENQFEVFYSLLEKDFCFDERRTKDDALKVFKNPNYHPNFIYNDDLLVGYFCYWDFGDFIFGEHLAILEELREKGKGSKFLQEFLKGLNKLFVFEVERPFDEQSARRIKFYQRFNLAFNDYDYVQPSYHEEGKEVPMIFISYPNKLKEKDYKRIVAILRKEVYCK